MTFFLVHLFLRIDSLFFQKVSNFVLGCVCVVYMVWYICARGMVYVCTWYVWECASTCVNILHLIVWVGVSPWAWSAQIHLVWLTSKPQGVLCVSLPSTGITGHYAWLYRSATFLNSVLLVAWQALHRLSHLPSSQVFVNLRTLTHREKKFQSPQVGKEDNPCLTLSSPSIAFPKTINLTFSL